MIGSPAPRGAVALGGGRGAAWPAGGWAVSAASGAIAASVTVAGPPQRRIATVDRAVMNRFTMHAPVEMPVRACVDQDRRPAYLTHPDTARATRCRLLALFGPSAMSDLSPECVPKRTFANATEFLVHALRTGFGTPLPGSMRHRNGPKRDDCQRGVTCLVSNSTAPPGGLSRCGWQSARPLRSGMLVHAGSSTLQGTGSGGSGHFRRFVHISPYFASHHIQ